MTEPSYRVYRMPTARRALVLAGLLAVALGPVAVTALALGGRGSVEPQAAASTKELRPRSLPTVTIAAVGDIALGGVSGVPPGDGAELFANVRRSLAADVVTGNLETALSDDPSGKCGAGSSGCFSFQVPPSFARGLRRAGFTVLSLANNHSRDAGESGLAETAAALDAAGIDSTGRPGEMPVLQAGAIRVAVVGFAPYPWAADLLDLAAARALVRKASSRADIVVVHMHAGAEGLAHGHVPDGDEHYLGERRGHPRAFAHAVVEAGADLVVGHGPHVLRALEWYRGRLIAYSLGNFSSHRNFDLTGPLGISAIMRVRLSSDGSWVDGEIVPVELVGTGAPRPDADAAALAALSQLSSADVDAPPRLGPTGELAPHG